MEVLLAGLLAAMLFGGSLQSAVAHNPRWATAATVFCGVFVQAAPFLALGVIVSGLIAAYVTPERLARWLPQVLDEMADGA